MKRLIFLLALLPVLAIGQTRTLPGTTIFPDLIGKGILKTDASGKLIGDTAKVATIKNLIDTSLGLRTTINGKPNFRNTGTTWFTSETGVLVLSGATELQLRNTYGGNIVGKFGNSGNVELRAAYITYSGYGSGGIFYHEATPGSGAVWTQSYSAAGTVTNTMNGQYWVDAGSSVNLKSGVATSINLTNTGYTPITLKYGLIGIGTTEPQAPIHVEGTGVLGQFGNSSLVGGTSQAEVKVGAFSVSSVVDNDPSQTATLRIGAVNSSLGQAQIEVQAETVGSVNGDRVGIKADLEIDPLKALIMTDETTNQRYRIYVSDGNLVLSPI